MDAWALLAGVGFLAGAVSGATGFGFALVATALWGQYFEPQRVTLLALVYMTLLNVAYLPWFWRQIPWRRLTPFVLGGAPGVPLGAWALGVLPVLHARLAIGAILLGYAAFMLRRRGDMPLFKVSANRGWALDLGVGFVSGVLGGLASLSGFLPTLWCAWRSHDKLANRGLVQGFILFSGLWGLLCVGHVVSPDEANLEQIVWGLPFVAVGGGLGLYVFSRLNHAQFMRLVLVLLMVCGGFMLLRSAMALFTA